MNTPKADLIIKNTAVHTVDPNQPKATAVAIQGNKIVYVGDDVGVKTFQTAKSRVIDGAGQTLMPGINDSHYHLLMGAKRLNHLDLASVQTLEELAAEIHRVPEQEVWVQGSGLTYTVAGDEPLTRHHLDAIEPDRPIQIFSLDFHTSWANTKAMEIAGLLHGGDVKDGGELLMGPDGLATGQINEDSDAVGRHIPKLTNAETRQLVRDAVAQMNAMGITSVTNMDGHAEQMALYAELAANDQFDLRITVPYSIKPDTAVSDLEKLAIPLKNQYSQGKVRAISVKLFIDGVVESGTAYLLENYGRWPDTLGFPLYEKEHYEALIVEADRLGFQVKVHAIGDAGVRMTLDAYEKALQVNGRRDSRHRIEHVELLHNDDLPRFKQLGVVAAMQPLHATRPAHNHYVNWSHCLDPQRYHRAFRWKELREDGVPLAFGSDWPVVTFDPYAGIEAAVSQTAWEDSLINQAQTLTETIESYTHLGAYAEFQEQEKGQIKSGMLADLVLLDCNLFEIPQNDIRHARPQLTLCDGKVVFEK